MRLTRADRIGLSIAAATGLHGPSLGALAVASGFSVAQAMVLWLLVVLAGAATAAVPRLLL